jgi:hypothetical protein
MSSSTSDAKPANGFKIDMPAATATELCAGAPGPTSPQLEKGASRAREATASWKPSLDRRQSYAREDQKHEMQMGGSGSGGSGAAEGQGFTERAV